ncbi:MAG: DNA repair protein RadC [Lachnospiraceae bacterium]|nr:DNA repair protein RadC [Lachnospiraceae bacterium]
MHESIKDLPEDERPYEKALKYGAESLTDTELLAVLLRSGTAGMNVKELADRVLKAAGQERSIGHLENLSVKELIQIRGIGPVKAIEIRCLLEFSKRMWNQKYAGRSSVTSASEAAGYYMEELRYKDTEHVCVMLLNTRNVVTGDFLMSKGTVSSSPVSVREIARKALSMDAVRVILVHNHPSGDPSPSSEDIAVARSLKQALSLVGIELLDSIVIGDGVYVSLREKRINF